MLRIKNVLSKITQDNSSRNLNTYHPTLRQNFYWYLCLCKVGFLSCWTRKVVTSYGICFFSTFLFDCFSMCKHNHRDLGQEWKPSQISPTLYYNISYKTDMFYVIHLYYIINLYSYHVVSTDRLFYNYGNGILTVSTMLLLLKCDVLGFFRKWDALDSHMIKFQLVLWLKAVVYRCAEKYLNLLFFLFFIIGGLCTVCKI